MLATSWPALAARRSLSTVPFCSALSTMILNTKNFQLKTANAANQVLQRVMREVYPLHGPSWSMHLKECNAAYDQTKTFQRVNWYIVRKHPWNIDLSNLQSYSNWKNMRIHIGSCCWASAQSGFEACRCNMRTKGNMYIIFSRNKTQCKRQTLQWNSQPRWKWQCFNDCSSCSIFANNDMSNWQRPVKFPNGSHETSHADFWATLWIKRSCTKHVSKKWRCVCSTGITICDIARKQAKKKHLNIQVGWKHITPVWFECGVTKKNVAHVSIFVFFWYACLLVVKKRQPLWILFAEKTGNQTPKKTFFDMVTKPKMDLGNLALTTLIWFSQLS